MKVIHIIENWENCDNQVIEIIAKDAKTALNAYVKHWKMFDDDVVEFEKLSENIFVATWNREWGF